MIPKRFQNHLNTMSKG